MDIKSMSSRILLISSILYVVNIIFSVSLYSLLVQISLPVSNISLRSILISVPLISAMFNALILAMITMSLKYAEYYGIGKSVLALMIYSAYWIYFKPPTYVTFMMAVIMGLNVIQLFDLYLYARLLKEMFG